MTIYYAILWTLLAAAALAVAYHVILTLTQVRRTAQELEFLARKANTEVEKVGGVTSAVANFAGSIAGARGRLAAGALNLVLGLFQRYRRGRPVDVPGDEGDPS